MNYVNGIDTSHWESDIDWTKVAQTQKFVFCKATEGLYYKDPDFKKDIQAFHDNGMLVAPYHFFRSGYDTLRQINFFLETIAGMPMDMPPVIDIEENKVVYGWANYQSAIKLALQTIEAATGKRPIIYTNKYYWGFTGNPVWAKDYPLWVANYGTMLQPTLPVGWDKWTFWQYSEAGRIDGVPYDGVDLNYFNGTYDDLLKFCGKEVTEPTEPPVVTQPDRLPQFLAELDALITKWS